MTRLKTDFFARPTIEVAKDLLGKELVFNNQRLIINETEAYIGEDDPACHAAVGRTKRTEVMYGPPGYSYIYLIYGMYHCLNFVTEEIGYPAAVLIRGGVLQGDHLLLDGPGKLCKRLGLNRDFNNIDITSNQDFYVNDVGAKLGQINSTSRIGISKGKDRMWRYVASL